MLLFKDNFNFIIITNMGKKTNNSSVWALDILHSRVKELRTRVYSFGLSSKQFIKIMKSIFHKVCLRSKVKLIKSEKDVFEYLNNRKNNNKDLIIELITLVDLQYGALESSDSVDADKLSLSHNSKEIIKLDDSNQQEFKDIKEIVKLEYTFEVKKEVEQNDKDDVREIFDFSVQS